MNKDFAKLYDTLERICHEPNYETFEYGGFKCLIKRVAVSGCLNGYVGVPKDHKFFGKHYDDIEIACHGGLTFSGEWGEQNDGLWYIGFDTSHAWDFMPFMAMKNHAMLGHTSLIDEESSYKDIHFVRQEIKNIVDQFTPRKRKD